jgi:hypothetical protein
VTALLAAEDLARAGDPVCLVDVCGWGHSTPSGGHRAGMYQGSASEGPVGPRYLE